MFYCLANKRKLEIHKIYLTEIDKSLLVFYTEKAVEIQLFITDRSSFERRTIMTQIRMEINVTTEYIRDQIVLMTVL